MMKNYASSQVDEVIASNSGSEYLLKMVICSDTMATKYLNITQEQAKKISEILRDKE